jgi:hypothetical protein
MTPLHSIGDTLRNLLLLIDLAYVRALFVAIPLFLLVWVLTLPRSVARPANGSGRLAEDLRLWAALALIIQTLIYTLA